MGGAPVGRGRDYRQGGEVLGPRRKLWSAVVVLLVGPAAAVQAAGLHVGRRAAAVHSAPQRAAVSHDLQQGEAPARGGVRSVLGVLGWGRYPAQQLPCAPGVFARGAATTRISSV